MILERDDEQPTHNQELNFLPDNSWAHLNTSTKISINIFLLLKNVFNKRECEYNFKNIPPKNMTSKPPPK
jgi:hypothetical protein